MNFKFVNITNNAFEQWRTHVATTEQELIELVQNARVLGPHELLPFNRKRMPGHRYAVSGNLLFVLDPYAMNCVNLVTVIVIDTERKQLDLNAVNKDKLNWSTPEGYAILKAEEKIKTKTKTKKQIANLKRQRLEHEAAALRRQIKAKAKEDARLKALFDSVIQPTKKQADAR